jgi:chromosome segregation ATPase
MNSQKTLPTNKSSLQHTLDNHEVRITSLSEKISRLEKSFRDQGELMSQIEHHLNSLEASVNRSGINLERFMNKLIEVDKKVHKHETFIITSENTLGVYADAHKANTTQNEELGKRVTKLEVHTGLRAPNDMN